MDSKIKTLFGTSLKIEIWMLLLWITHCPLIFVHISTLSPSTVGALVIDALNSDTILVNTKKI